MIQRWRVRLACQHHVIVSTFRLEDKPGALLLWCFACHEAAWPMEAAPEVDLRAAMAGG